MAALTPCRVSKPPLVSLRIVRVSERASVCVCGDRHTLRHHHGLPHLKVRAPLIGSFQVAQTSPKKTNRVLHTHASPSLAIHTFKRLRTGQRKIVKNIQQIYRNKEKRQLLAGVIKTCQNYQTWPRASDFAQNVADSIRLWFRHWTWSRRIYSGNWRFYFFQVINFTPHLRFWRSDKADRSCLMRSWW